MKILEMGGGHNPFPFDEDKYSVTRVDWNPVGADVVHNLNKFPYPFSDSSFGLIYSSHCIEHIEDKFKVFWELYRLLKKDGRAIIRVPHLTSVDAFNFDHLHMWKTGSMNCFVHADWYGGGSFPKFELISEKLNWRILDSMRLYKNSAEDYCQPEVLKKGINKYGLHHKMIKFLINRHQYFAEKFLQFWLFGISEIEFCIKPIKDQ